MTDYKVHRARFIEFMPKAINSASFDVDSKLPKVALSREDGSIEIRDPANQWIVNQIIPGQDGRTVEHLVWLNGRLFSGGLNGQIIEWDLELLKPKYTQDSYGGPVWCLKFNHSKTHLAAGCEDGSVRLFEVFADSISYERCLHRQEHRILSLAWSHCNDFIITGGFDCTMRMYNVKSGQIISRMTTDNLKDSNTVVWSIEFLSNMTVVIGDSLGNTQFWDGRNGTLLQSFKSHLADVLAVVVCNNEHTVYSTGVDSKVTQFNFVQLQHESKWVQTKSIRSTSHDTRTLAVCSQPYNCMISGGVDPRFVVYDLDDFSSQTYVRHSCLPQHNTIQLAGGANLLSFQEQQKVHVWSLKNIEEKVSKPKKLFEVKSDAPDHLLCSALSTNGKYLAYSSLSKNRLLQLSVDGTKPMLKKITKMKLPVSSQMCFTHDEEMLIIVGFEKLVHIFSLETGEEFQPAFPNGTAVKLPFSYICTSYDDNYLCVVDSISKCFIFSLEENRFVTQLPAMDGQITCCSFHPKTNNLFIVTSNKYVYEFNIESEKFVPWSFSINKSEIISKKMGRLGHKINNIVFNPKNDDEMFVQTKEVIGKMIYGCGAESKEEEEPKQKKPKKNELLKTLGRYYNMMFFDFNASGEMVIVERPMPNILENLPSALKIKKFGN